MAEAPPGAGSVLLYEELLSLSGVPNILANLTSDELRRVEEAGRPVPFAAGDHLFRQGQPHRGIFILRNGVVRSYYASPSGREITLANWTPGNFVGGPEVFGGGLHVWSGVAVAPGVATRLSGAAVRRLMTQIPSFAIGLVEGLAFKGKCYSALLQMLGTRSVLERLAHLLFNLAERHGIAAGEGVVIAGSPTHGQLAAMVGATRQWVSMTIERFRAQELIAVRARQIVVLRMAALRAIADGDRVL